MSVVTEAVRVTRAWTGVETVIPTGLPIKDIGDIRIAYSGPAGNFNLSLRLHFDVVKTGGELTPASNADVIPLAMPPAPAVLTITRDTPALQPNNFDTGFYDPVALERELDAGALRDAELKADIETLQGQVGKAVLVPPVENSVQIPTIVQRAGRLAAYDAQGVPIAVPMGAVPQPVVSTGITDSSLAGRNLLTAASAAAQRALLGVSTSIVAISTAAALGARNFGGEPPASVLLQGAVTPGIGAGVYNRNPVADITSPFVITSADGERWERLRDRNVMRVGKSGWADFSRLHDALFFIPRTGPNAPSAANRWLVEIGPGLYMNEGLAYGVPTWTDIKGEQRKTVRLQAENDEPTFRLEAGGNQTLEEMSVETTNSSLSYAVEHVNGAGYLHFRRFDILGGSFFNTQSLALKIHGNTWRTVLADDCIWDIGSRFQTNGAAIDLRGNPADPQDIDLHFTNVFADCVSGLAVNPIVLRARDTKFGNLRQCLFRTLADGTGVRVERTNPTGPGTCDLRIEDGSSRGAFVFGGASVGEGCTLQVTNTQLDFVRSFGSGQMIYFDGWRNRVLPSRDTFADYNIGTRTVSQDFAGAIVLRQDNAPFSLGGIERTLPAAPYRFDVAMTMPQLTKPVLRAGLMLRNDAADRIQFFGIVGGNLVLSRHLSTTNFDGDYFSHPIGGNELLWMRHADDGITRYWAISTTGRNYNIVYTAPSAFFKTTPALTFTPTRIGLCLNAENSAAAFFPHLAEFVHVNTRFGASLAEVQSA
jgi:hypothetical protein